MFFVTVINSINDKLFNLTVNSSSNCKQCY